MIDAQILVVVCSFCGRFYCYFDVGNVQMEGSALVIRSKSNELNLFVVVFITLPVRLPI